MIWSYSYRLQLGLIPFWSTVIMYLDNARNNNATNPLPNSILVSNRSDGGETFVALSVDQIVVPMNISCIHSISIVFIQTQIMHTISLHTCHIEPDRTAISIIKGFIYPEFIWNILVYWKRWINLLSNGTCA